MKKFKGIFPALLTPFTNSGKINEKALEALVLMNMKKGVDGFYAGGSTGEAFLLSSDERKYILDIVSDTVKGKCTLISHVGSISTDEAIRLAKHASEAGADAISAIPPFYYNFSFPEIKSYYYDIVSSVNLPMIIYNFPAFSGVSLNEENISEFLCDKRFMGVKHTSNDFFSLERFKNKFPDAFMYNGFDEMFLAGLSMGADGGIGSTYNFMAEKFIEIYKLFNENKSAQAVKIQSEVNDIIKMIIKIGVLPAEKEILNQMGLDFGFCRSPFKKPDDNDKKIISKIIKKL